MLKSLHSFNLKRYTWSAAFFSSLPHSPLCVSILCKNQCKFQKIKLIQFLTCHIWLRIFTHARRWWHKKSFKWCFIHWYWPQNMVTCSNRSEQSLQFVVIKNQINMKWFVSFALVWKKLLNFFGVEWFFAALVKWCRFS